jgi:hypothetical protein
LDTPPVSSYFDIKQRIQPPKIPIKEPETIIVPPPPVTALAIPPPAPSATAAPATGTSSLLELVMLNMLQAQAQNQAHFSAFGYPHLPASGVQPSSIPIAIPTHTTSPVPTSPGPKPVHPRVSLDEFCTHYSISLADRERLDKLEYCPGDAIEKLDREDWQGEAGFSKLAWCRMLDVHRTFMRDVKRGVWLPAPSQ